MSSPAVSTEPAQRRVVFVVGSEGSGASTVSGALQALGLHVPQAESAVVDGTEPLGPAESAWVVDFHRELLARANVEDADARPSAWFETGKLSANGILRTRLTDWLGQQFGEESPELVVAEPGLPWFLGLWRAAVMRCGATPVHVITLGPATEMIGTSGDQGSRAAAWVNLMLHTERATRGSLRAFVRYDELRTDWTVPLFHLGTSLDLRAVQEASANDIRRAHAYVAPTLSRSAPTGDEPAVPPRLREVTDEAWQGLSKLADSGGDNPDVHALLDEVRASYASLYAEAEGIARSSAAAARREGSTTAAPDVARGWRRLVGRVR